MLKSLFKFFLFLLCFLTAEAAFAEEKIELFAVDITVMDNGSLEVVENITVHHEGKEIRRGIVRELSTRKYESYKVHEVLRDGKPEPWFIEKSPYSVDVNTGDDSFLPNPGTSTFTISYTLEDVLRPIRGQDANELYLNVTGKWPFWIRKVTVDVHYPEGTEVLRQYGYKGDDIKRKFVNGESIEFYDVGAYQEVSIAQAFSKGTVRIALPKVWRVLLWALFWMFFYYVLVWHFLGRDPIANAVVPDWEAPHNLTPLECAYLDRNGSQPSNSFFIHLVWLVAQGVVDIKEILSGKKKTYEVITLGEKAGGDEETILYRKHYPRKMILDGEPQQALAIYCGKVNKNINDKMEKGYYHKRGWITFWGALIAPGILCYFYPEYLEHLFFVFWYLTTMAPIMARSKIYATILTVIVAVPMILIGVNEEPYLYLAFVVYLLTVLVFWHLMFQPTVYGQRQKEKIEGLKMFLKTINNGVSVAKEGEKSYGLDMGKRLTPLDMEKLFPYAVALGLEKEWSAKYKAVFGDVAAAQSSFGSPCYNHIMQNSNGLSNISKACAKTAVGPASSGSGSYGGGHGGGGFGGGGGHGR